MSKLNCDILPPFHDDTLRGCSGCIRPWAHLGEHHDETPRWGPIAWEDDYDCDCCGPDEQDRCIVWSRRQALADQRGAE